VPSRNALTAAMAQDSCAAIPLEMWAAVAPDYMSSSITTAKPILLTRSFKPAVTSPKPCLATSKPSVLLIP
jgi:hypothetical protein